MSRPVSRETVKAAMGRQALDSQTSSVNLGYLNNVSSGSLHPKLPMSFPPGESSACGYAPGTIPSVTDGDSVRGYHAHTYTRRAVSRLMNESETKFIPQRRATFRVYG